jgi:hypothetical protein
VKGFAILTADDERDGWVHVCAPMFGWVEIRNGGGINLLRVGKTLQG